MFKVRNMNSIESNWSANQETVNKSRTWFLLVMALGAFSNIVYVCVAPLAGFGAIAGATLPKSKAIVAVLTMWLVGQVLGFGFMGYPWDFSTFAWGIVLGVAAMAAMLLAAIKPAFSRKDLAGHVIWLGVSAIAGFGLCELVIWSSGFILGEAHGFSLVEIRDIFAGNMVWAIALALIHSALSYSFFKGLVPKSN
jgi:hypothetical protein